ncbi:MAG: ATP synthase F1 subunit gamma [Candidatus Paceibacterota bacterium]
MNFRAVEKKIKTVSNVKKITRAMQMVSAVKMRKSQEQALQTRPYTQKLESMLLRILKSKDFPKDAVSWFKKTSTSKKLHILITSNKGLAGSFNANLFRFMANRVSFDSDNFITMGKRGADFVRRMGGEIEADFSKEVPFIDQANAVFTLVKEGYMSDRFGHVSVIYNQFESTFIRTPAIEPFLPLEDIAKLAENQDQDLADSSTHKLYLIEPKDTRILESLIADLLTQKVRRAILDSQASEHSARMMAMQQATDNATELIFGLTLLRNKLRQTSITNELLEMSAAKESTEISN